MIPVDVDVVRHSRPIIVGSGIAGLSTALSLKGSIVVSAAEIGEGSSALAQGGMAAAIAKSDKPSAHAADTLAVGSGIVDDQVARLIAAAAPDQVGWLTDIGARFDLDAGGELALGREAGHSTRRIVHAGGDATGAEIMRALRTATHSRSDIHLVARTRLIDLVRSGDRIAGILTTGPEGALTAHISSVVVLATGGIGGLYRRSTNPRDVEGTGLAAAARQGVRLADLEFVQFHPTALATTDHPAPLATEALRGEGATLVDEMGHRFMQSVHPDAELAPRDIVSRAIWDQMVAGHSVFLDTTSSIGTLIETEFPTVFASCRQAGVDARTQPIPIAPAEHYHMGGVDTDDIGRSSVPGLYAIGEVASTGLHGANRLASNSLVEALVMGRRAAKSIARESTVEPAGPLTIPKGADTRQTLGSPAHTAEIQGLAWAKIGIVRTAAGLRSALDMLHHPDTPQTDATLVARLIATAALNRDESRGAHHRSDFPALDPDQAARSSATPQQAAQIALRASHVQVA